MRTKVDAGKVHSSGTSLKSHADAQEQLQRCSGTSVIGLLHILCYLHVTPSPVCRTFAAETGTCNCPAVSTSNPCPCANVSPKAAPQYCTTLQNGLYAPNNGTQPPL